jgi:hypothetical protein
MRGLNASRMAEPLSVVGIDECEGLHGVRNPSAIMLVKQSAMVVLQKRFHKLTGLSRSIRILNSVTTGERLKIFREEIR